MIKLAAAAFVAFFATSALAQTDGLPPTQPAVTGKKIKFKKPTLASEPKVASAAPAPKPTTREGRREARQATRDAKVGDKPID